MCNSLWLLCLDFPNIKKIIVSTPRIATAHLKHSWNDFRSLRDDNKFSLTMCFALSKMYCPAVPLGTSPRIPRFWAIVLSAPNRMPTPLRTQKHFSLSPRRKRRNRFSRKNRNRRKRFSGTETRTSLLICTEMLENSLPQRNRPNRKTEPPEPFHNRTVTEPNRTGATLRFTGECTKNSGRWQETGVARVRLSLLPTFCSVALPERQSDCPELPQ